MTQPLKLKTVYGSITYVLPDDLARAQQTGRLVPCCDRDGNPANADGERKRYALGNLLTDTDRKAVRVTETRI
ncbi:MAG: hypothetical protein J0H99_14440 [Rhodospirillales bacterium]|nr:hypothetical protein [Rhodospirillales bacterium]